MSSPEMEPTAFAQPSMGAMDVKMHEKNFFAQIKSMVWRKDAFLVVLMFLLALVVRWQLARYELFFEFDSYWSARMVSYLLQGLPIPSIDPLAYYQNAAAAAFAPSQILFWYLSAAIYKIFTLNAPYNLDLWVAFVKVLPALYGALTSLAMYFLGKELFKGPHEKAAGFLSGFFAAVVPAFVYRTMGGFFEGDSLGFLFMVMGFVFFLRAARNPEWKKENILNAVYAGISYSLMIFTSLFFNLQTPILLGAGALAFLIFLKEHELEKAKAFAMLWFVSFLIYAIVATFVTQTFWLSQFGTILGNALIRAELPYWATLGVMVLIFALLGVAWWTQKKQVIPTQIMRYIISAILLLIILTPLLTVMLNINFQTHDVLGQTIGEESPGHNYFGNKYSMLILSLVVALPALAYLLIKKPHGKELFALPIVWLAVTFVMAWGKLKFTYYMGLPLALMCAIVGVFALSWMSHRTVLTKRVVVALVAIMMLCGLAAGTLFVTQNVPNIESSPGWKEALFWSEKHLPTDAKFFNWWDEGHWISFLTNRKTLIDNRNADTKGTSNVAKFILAKDENEAYSIVSNYGSTDVIFGDDLLEKLTNLGLYAYPGANPNSDPRFAGLFGRVIACNKSTAPLTKEVTYNCGGNAFTTAQMDAFPTAWTSTPNQLQQGTPLYIYREADNSKIYALAQEANKTMLARLWFSDPTITHFQLLYKNYGGVRIYQVLYADAMMEHA